MGEGRDALLVDRRIPAILAIGTDSRPGQRPAMPVPQDPASTMATRVANGPQEAPGHRDTSAAGTLKPTASPSVTTSTHRTSRMNVFQSDLCELTDPL
jgi:hypothetical protein